MARRLAEDADAGMPRRSVADLLREAGIDQSAAPRRRRRYIEPDNEQQGDGEPGEKPEVAEDIGRAFPSEDVPEPPDADQGLHDEDETTSPIARINDAEPDSEPAVVPAREHSGVAHWALPIGEVILAIVIGAGLSFVFRLLWDIAPYAAAVLAPVVICAVVAIVGFTRKKMGLGSIPLSLLLLVLFVTALLVVIPAALVLAAP